jgi:hypothetical protein
MTMKPSGTRAKRGDAMVIRDEGWVSSADMALSASLHESISHTSAPPSE